MGKISETGWFIRREGLVGEGDCFELNSKEKWVNSGESDERGC